MSRSNAKAARALREDESIQLKKSILKAGVYSNADALNLLQSSDSHVNEKLSQLQKFTAKSKILVKTISHQNEWQDENNRLKKIAQKTENSIFEMLQTILIGDPSCVEIHNLLSEYDECRISRKSNQDMIINQLHDIKQMMTSFMKNQQKEQQNQKRKSFTVEEQITSSSNTHQHTTPPGVDDSSISKDNNSTSSTGVITGIAIVAELLMKIRSDHANNWKQLVDIERLLTSDIKSCKVKLLEMIRDDVIGEQDQDLKDIFDNIINPVHNDNNYHYINNNGNESNRNKPNDENHIEINILINEWYQKIAILDHKQREMMHLKEEQISQFCNEIQVDPSHTYGGWDAHDHDIFSKEFKKAQVSGTKRKIMLDMLSEQLPNKSLDEILIHEEWYRKMRLIQTKFKDSDSIYRTTRQDMIQQAKDELSTLLTSLKERDIQEALLKKQEDYRLLIKQQLEEMRLMKENENQQKLHDHNKLQEELKLKLKQAEELMQQQQIEKKSRLEQYQKMKEEAEAEAQRKRLEQEEKLKTELKMLIEANRHRVEHRTKLIHDKDEKRKLKEAELALAEEKKMEFLIKLSQQVPYYDSIENIESKLEQATVSTLAQMYVKNDELNIYRGHIPMNGFTDQKVIKDSRFRLASALRSAGVHNSDAARQVVAQIFSRPHLAIHGIV
eukprot:gene6977-9537_t